MSRRITDALLVLVILSFPLFGILQACSGGGVVIPDSPRGPTDQAPEDNHPPVAIFEVVGESEGPTPFTVELDASGSNDPDGDEIEFMWIFSDNTTDEGPVITHEFESSGRYEVRLIVTDVWGTEAQAGPETIYGWGLANSPWPKFAHDERNSGVSPNVGPMMDLEHADEGGAFPRYWRTGVETDKITGICIGYDGMVVYTQGPWLRARTSDGMWLWDVEFESAIKAWPAIAHDGSIITGTEQGWVHRVSEDGELMWSTNLSDEVGEQVILRSAVNIDHRGTTSISGIVEHYTIPVWLFSLGPDGVLNWSFTFTGYRAMPSNGIIETNPRYITALTTEGNIVVNGEQAHLLQPDGEEIIAINAPTEKFGNVVYDFLGPPVLDEDNNIVFSSPVAPMHFPGGFFYMTLMDVQYNHQYGTFMWTEQCAVWSSRGVNQIISTSYYSYGDYFLCTRTDQGDYFEYKLFEAGGDYDGSFQHPTAIFGSIEDSEGTVFTSCFGLRAISPVEYQTYFPYQPRRYSLWTYTRPSSHMTSPVIGEDGWLYVGYGNDILAIGD